MSRLRRGATALVATATGLGGLALTGGTASANHNSLHNAPCMVINADTTLTEDVGPCAGHGIVVNADHITLDLNGHTVSGAKRAMEQVGVLLNGVEGVTVKNGSVTGFDAGVSIEGGGGNTVTGMNVHDNFNDLIEPVNPRSIIISGGMPTPEQAFQVAQVTCIYGDGITAFDSSDNLIEGNTVTNNGPYGGITLVDDSNGNTVRGNHVADNDDRNIGVTIDGVNMPPWGDANTTGMCGATEIGTPGMGRGRLMQAINIRVEGPGADGNLIEKNTVVKGGLAGISFHSFVLVPAAPHVPVGSSNRFNTVRGNDVSRTGEESSAYDTFADGIAWLTSGPAGTVTRPSDSNTAVGNKSHDNFRHGISLGRLTYGNTVATNVVLNNGGSGIWVAGPVAPNPSNPSFDFRGAYDNTLRSNAGNHNAMYDGEDRNPDCGTNTWIANGFKTFNQKCVAPGNSGSARSEGSAASASLEGLQRGGR